MIIGISLGQETCRIHGQVSLKLFYWKKKTSKRIHVVRVEVGENTAHIQARSSVARALEVNGNTPS